MKIAWNSTVKKASERLWKNGYLWSVLISMWNWGSPALEKIFIWNWQTHWLRSWVLSQAFTIITNVLSFATSKHSQRITFFLSKYFLNKHNSFFILTYWSLGLMRRRQNLKKKLSYFWQERRVLCAKQCTCQKVDEDFSKQMWTSCII